MVDILVLKDVYLTFVLSLRKVSESQEGLEMCMIAGEAGFLVADEVGSITLTHTYLCTAV